MTIPVIVVSILLIILSVVSLQEIAVYAAETRQHPKTLHSKQIVVSKTIQHLEPHLHDPLSHPTEYTLGPLHEKEISVINRWARLKARVLPFYAPCSPLHISEAEQRSLEKTQSSSSAASKMIPQVWYCGPWATCQNIQRFPWVFSVYRCIPKFAKLGERCGIRASPMRCAHGLECQRMAWTWFGRGQRKCVPKQSSQ